MPMACHGCPWTYSSVALAAALVLATSAASASLIFALAAARDSPALARAAATASPPWPAVAFNRASASATTTLKSWINCSFVTSDGFASALVSIIFLLDIDGKKFPMARLGSGERHSAFPLQEHLTRNTTLDTPEPIANNAAMEESHQ